MVYIDAAVRSYAITALDGIKGTDIIDTILLVCSVY